MCFCHCEARSKKTNKKAPVWVLKLNSLKKVRILMDIIIP